MTKEQRTRRWAGILLRYAEWQGSVEEFCAREGISPSSFYYWRRKERLASEEGFVRLRVKSEGDEVPSAGVRLKLGPFGVEVDLPSCWDEQRVGRLLKALL